MRRVGIAGAGLACGLGLSLAESRERLAKLSVGGTGSGAGFGTTPGVAGLRELPGALGGYFPYYAIPYAAADWHDRARDLIRHVVAESGARPHQRHALLLASSSFDVGAADTSDNTQPAADYDAFLRQIALWLDWSGPTLALSTACTSSSNALRVAAAMMRAGQVDEALVLGVELENRLTLGGFAALQLLSRTGSQPFGIRRDGLVLGESVAAIRLVAADNEDWGWSLVGGAHVVDGDNPTGASAAALASVFAQTLRSSGWSAAAVDLVKVQAAGSPGNDAVEADVLRATFSSLPALMSLKPVIGHTMGASGAAELALLMTCIDYRLWPPIAGQADPALGVALAAAPPATMRKVLATILGFGGSHATLALERHP